jgi:hypothetical protein
MMTRSLNSSKLFRLVLRMAVLTMGVYLIVMCFTVGMPLITAYGSMVTLDNDAEIVSAPNLTQITRTTTSTRYKYVSGLHEVEEKHHKSPIGPGPTTQEYEDSTVSEINTTSRPDLKNSDYYNNPDLSENETPRKEIIIPDESVITTLSDVNPKVQQSINLQSVRKQHLDDALSRLDKLTVIKASNDLMKHMHHHLPLKRSWDSGEVWEQPEAKWIAQSLAEQSFGDRRIAFEAYVDYLTP